MTQTSSMAEREATLAALADEWEEQNRLLHWAFRDRGLETAGELFVSPFGPRARKSAPTSLSMPFGAVRV